jgi:biotin synthase
MNLQEILLKENLTKEDIVSLLGITDKTDLEKLFKKANEIRESVFGSDVHLKAVVEISNYCRENCMYCGLREDNFSVKRYRMQTDEIIETAKQISNLGIQSIVLMSGQDDFYDTDLIAYLIYSIKQRTNMSVTLSLGERGLDEYRAWKIAGADSYLLKHESVNKKHYGIYHNQERLRDRIQHLDYLRRLGYKIGTGNIIGLPLQKNIDIAEDILISKALKVDTFVTDPFVPASFTPYQNKKPGSIELTLKTMAIARIVMKNVQIPVNGSFDSVETDGREKALKCGANVIMPDFTPLPYRGFYRIYPNKKGDDADPVKAHALFQIKIESLGRTILHEK